MALVPQASTLLVLAVVLIAGAAFGTLAKRVRLPSVTGQILAGVLLGKAGLHVFDVDAVAALAPITKFALGLMTVTVGAHLNVRRLRNAQVRLSLLLAMEILFVPGLVFVGLLFFQQVKWSSALLLATIAISTAPATIVAIVKETRSKGVFVKTLIAAVALNNIACVLFFEMARAATHIDLGGEAASAWSLVGLPLRGLVASALLGAGAAIGMHLVQRWVARREMVTTGAIATLLLTLGAAEWLEISPLLSCLFVGVVQANLSGDRTKVLDSLFATFEPAILAAFFTLAGLELTLGHAATIGPIAVAFFLLRLLGKLAAGRVAMRLARVPKHVEQNLGLALVPQAGVAVGLILLLEKDAVLREQAPHVLPVFVAVVLTAVVLNEIVGPILTRLALERSGEAGRDRMRLIDFLQEENITTSLVAKTKQGAIEQLVDLLVTSHNLSPDLRDPLLRSALEREEEMSTCLGGGLAVPHAILPTGKRMLGVMAIDRAGLPFETPDGVPVHCMVLLATPESDRDRHLQVLATLAGTIGSNADVQAQLYRAQSPAHAYEILHGKDAETFNYFFEQLDEVTP